MKKFTKFAGAVAAVALVSACATSSGPDVDASAGADTSAGAGPVGPVPGSQGDLEESAGHQVFFAYDQYTLTAQSQAHWRNRPLGCKNIRRRALNSQATVTSAAPANTTWLWVLAALKRLALTSFALALTPTASRRFLTVKNDRAALSQMRAAGRATGMRPRRLRPLVTNPFKRVMNSKDALHKNAARLCSLSHSFVVLAR